MILELATIVALARQCAPSVAVETLVSVVHTESRFNPYAIGVNTKGVAAPHPIDAASAATAARSLIARGYNIDLGLGQINSSNLKWLDLSVEDAFDPCRNLAAAARVLSSNYLSVARSSQSTEAAIAAAMSMYNTGSRSRGFGNGYVGRVYASASIVVPAIRAEPTPIFVTPVFAKQPGRDLRVDAVKPVPNADRKWDTSAGTQTAELMVFGATSSSWKKGKFE